MLLPMLLLPTTLALESPRLINRRASLGLGAGLAGAALESPFSDEDDVAGAPLVDGAVEDDERRIAHLLIDQIEFADVIVLNKLDLVSKEQALEVEAIINALNPGAKSIRTTRGQVQLESVLDF